MSTDTQMKKKRLDDLIWMTRNIRSDDIARERDLLLMKWFDYRFLSPLEATELFIEAYRRQYKIAFAREVDRSRSGEVHGIRMDQFYGNAKLRTQAWRARQRADETGMTYDAYMQASFAFASRKSIVNDDGKTRARMLLSVSQLHHPNSAAEAWDEFRTTFWSELLDNRVVEMPVAAAFREELYEDLPAQLDFRQKWPRIAAASSSGMVGWMQHFSHVKRQIPFEEFRSVMSADRFQSERDKLDAEIRHYGAEPEEMPLVNSTTTWQSCFGLITGDRSHAPTCASCPVTEQCRTMQRFVNTCLTSICGTTDPVGDEKRSKGRARQAALRERRALKKRAALHQQVAA